MGTLEQSPVTAQRPTPYDLTINGNYLIATTLGLNEDTATSAMGGFEPSPISRYPQTTEFQLRNVYFKTENDAFILRDSTYRLIFDFELVELGYITIEKQKVGVRELFQFLCNVTGSNNLPLQEGEIIPIGPRA